MSDPVRPTHYSVGTPHEVAGVCEAWLTPEEFRGHCRCTAIEYLARAGRKGDAIEDLRKALWWVEREIAHREAGTPEP